MMPVGSGSRSAAILVRPATARLGTVSASEPPVRVAISTGWRRALGIVAIVAAVLAVYLYGWPPDKTTTTDANGTKTTETSTDRPDSLILGAAGVALVFGLAALSAGAVGLARADDD